MDNRIIGEFADKTASQDYKMAIAGQRNQIIQLKQQLTEANEALRFYGDLSNWRGEDMNGWNATNIICESDQDEKLVGAWEKGCAYPEEDEYEDVGGKRARAYIEKWKVE